MSYLVLVNETILSYFNSVWRFCNLTVNLMIEIIPMKRIVAIIFIILMMLLQCNTSLAFEISNGDLIIKSDSLVVDQKKNIATFKGLVTLFFNDLCLKTYEIRVLYKQVDNKNTIEKIIIPNKLNAIRSIDDGIVIADSAEYNAHNNELILTGNVTIQHDGNILSTDKMIYITNLNEIKEN